MNHKGTKITKYLSLRFVLRVLGVFVVKVALG